jgi:hypothetical protein
MPVGVRQLPQENQMRYIAIMVLAFSLLSGCAPAEPCKDVCPVKIDVKIRGQAACTNEDCACKDCQCGAECRCGQVWWVDARNPDQAFLTKWYDENEVTGGFDWKTATWFPYRGVWGKGQWGQPAPLPPGTPPLGVDGDKLTGASQYWHNGKAVDRQYILAVFAKLQDDRNKLHLTVIGNADEQKRVIAELPPELKATVKVHGYSPDSWAIAGLGFVSNGSPTIYLQAPDGKVLWRQDRYSGANDFQAIRKKVDAYDPARDPGPNGVEALPVAWILAGAAGFLLLTRKDSV